MAARRPPASRCDPLRSLRACTRRTDKRGWWAPSRWAVGSPPQTPGSGDGGTPHRCCVRTKWTPPPWARLADRWGARAAARTRLRAARAPRTPSPGCQRAWPGSCAGRWALPTSWPSPESPAARCLSRRRWGRSARTRGATLARAPGGSCAGWGRCTGTSAQTARSRSPARRCSHRAQPRAAAHLASAARGDPGAPPQQPSSPLQLRS
mmetsp:Transcript_13034/g.24907  ORF Transcript_13034/g.24907 Transcript_13034/m.24907 type:complete len:208 (+) Transcript_13034:520-1143(+)